MNELLVKDILPELEKAPDVRQRIEEVRKKPAPSRDNANWSNGTSLWPAFAISTASSVLFNDMNSMYWNQSASMRAQTLAQFQNAFPAPSGGVNLRDEYDEPVRKRTSAAGIFEAMTNWFSK